MFRCFAWAVVGAVLSNFMTLTILSAAENELDFIVSRYETMSKYNETSAVSDAVADRKDDSIDRVAITSSSALKADLKRFYNDNPLVVAVNSESMKNAIENIEEIEILELVDTSLILKVKYRWIINYFQKTGIDFLIFFVEVVPMFSNFKYDEELSVGAEDSQYPDIAAYIASLGLPVESLAGANACQYDHFAPNPCSETRELWQAFAEREGLELNRDSAEIFRAYVNQQYGRADKVYAKVKGYRLPTYSGYGKEIDAMRAELRKLQSYKRHGSCEFNHYSPNPCPGVGKMWNEFAKRHGLALDPLSAGIFEAYAEQDFRRGDRLYAVAKGLPIPGYRGPGESVLAMRRELSQSNMNSSTSFDCAFNHFDPNPCPRTLQLSRDFAAKHGFEFNLASANIFEAYVDGNYRRGDRLFASVMGVSVDQLVNPDRKPPPPPMIIDILPSTIDSSMLPSS